MIENKQKEKRERELVCGVRKKNHKETQLCDNCLSAKKKKKRTIVDFYAE